LQVAADECRHFAFRLMFACFPAHLPAWLPPCLPACSNKLLRGFKVAEDDISEPESEVRLPASLACMHACMPTNLLQQNTAFCSGEV
jgi:hypothetical protein